MFKKVYEIIKEELSGDRAKEYVTDISRFHRVQASPGFRKAAHYVKKQLEGWNIESNIHQYKADGKTWYWGALLFEEWDIKDATLHLIEPEKKKLADFKGVQTSIIQRSGPFEGEVEVVLLEDGEEEQEYVGLDLKGKAVMTKGNIHRVSELAVEKYGAVGIIYDGMRETPPVRTKMELPKGVEYAAFWWSLNSKKAFGFVLSPQQGVYLRDLIKNSKKEGKSPVKVKAKVDSSFYSGYFEVVEAFLPGKTDEEVMLVAHLCHPQPSANDNASGSGALLEIARILKTLLKEGKLPPLKRGIRFLWVPEMSGTYAYLASNPDIKSRTIAAVNLDMVGERQDETHSILRLVNTPMAMPSFVNTLMSKVADVVSREDESLDAIKGEVVPSFRIASTPYSGGSDHFILTDPTVGIPCLMMGQWPDLFYHTSLDTPDKVDPNMLFASSMISSLYAYFIANAGEEEANWLGREMVTYFKKRVLTFIQKEVNKVNYKNTDYKEEEICLKKDKKLSFREKLDFLLDRELHALETLKQLNSNCSVLSFQAEITDFVMNELSRVANYLKEEHQESQELCDLAKEAAKLIPIRIYPGPVFITWFHQHRLSPEDKEKLHRLSKEHKETFRSLPEIALYWANGERNILEISRLVELETGKRDLKLLLEYFRLLEKIELIRFK